MSRRSHAQHKSGCKRSGPGIDRKARPARPRVDNERRENQGKERRSGRCPHAASRGNAGRERFDLGPEMSNKVWQIAGFVNRDALCRSIILNKRRHSSLLQDAARLPTRCRTAGEQALRLLLPAQQGFNFFQTASASQNGLAGVRQSLASK